MQRQKRNEDPALICTSPTYLHSTYLNRFGVYRAVLCAIACRKAYLLTSSKPQCPSSHRTRGEVHSRSNTSWLVTVKMHQWAWSLVGKFIACAGGSSCIFEARDVVIPRVCRSHHGNFTLCTARGPEHTERNPQHKHTCMASGNRRWQDEAEVDEKEKGRRLLLVMELSSKLLCTTNYDALFFLHSYATSFIAQSITISHLPVFKSM
jgi:hypothetical protein